MKKVTKVALSLLIGLAAFVPTASAQNHSLQIKEIAQPNPTSGKSFKNIVSGLSVSQKNHLTRSLYKFNNFNEFDINHYTNDQIIEWITWGGGLDKDFRYESGLGNFFQEGKLIPAYNWYYYPITKTRLDAFTMRSLGIKLKPGMYDADSDGLPEAFYKNNLFYFIGIEAGGDPMNYSPQVHKLYDLGNGLHYAEFNMHSWLYDGTDSSNEAASIDTWTAGQKARVTEKVPGYAVLRKVKTNAGYDWRLVRYSTEDGKLSNAQIQAYAKRK
ncbi:hypothetical protein [Saccharibacillus deserti]|uniref:hypothetical protein n=1 Tax=Saccharibacillus deserti TaxID=1634444 RepID=UPI001555F538|nr:hypothetical protein [Saccharibacillus deserti]